MSETTVRRLSVARPVRVVMVGGFLGAGKTTAIGALARLLNAQGHPAAVLTNDQAAHLVDTATVKGLGLPVAEVAGGCFCCRFDDFIGAAETALASGPEVLLCEPVGSCTDVAATVLNPLRRFYGESLTVGPLTVLVDPARVREAVLNEMPPTFPDEVAYIFRKQLEEADIIALSKVDTLNDAEAERLRDELAARYGRPVLLLSASRGDGMEAWAAALLAATPAVSRGLAEIDYDTYAEGEAVLGWLNATATITASAPFDADLFLTEFAERAREKCRESGAEIAHWKALIEDESERTRRAHYTGTTAPLSLSGSAIGPISRLAVTLNARVRMDPGALADSMRVALNGAASAVGAHGTMETLASFRPGYPRPPHRIPVLA